MPLPETVLPVRMRRIAVVAPRDRLREALVALADDGGVELSGELPAPAGPRVDALRRLEREPGRARASAADQPHRRPTSAPSNAQATGRRSRARPSSRAGPDAAHPPRARRRVVGWASGCRA